jgi:hypothetical protein
MNGVRFAISELKTIIRCSKKKQDMILKMSSGEKRRNSDLASMGGMGSKIGSAQDKPKGHINDTDTAVRGGAHGQGPLLEQEADGHGAWRRHGHAAEVGHPRFLG